MDEFGFQDPVNYFPAQNGGQNRPTAVLIGEQQ